MSRHRRRRAHRRRRSLRARLAELLSKSPELRAVLRTADAMDFARRWLTVPVWLDIDGAIVIDRGRR